MDGGGGDGGEGRKPMGSGGPSGDAARRALSLALARAPSLPPSLRARGLAPSRFPGDEGRGGAEAGTRFGRRPEVSAAGLGGGGWGILGRARARRRAPVLPAPPPAGCVWLRGRALARACVRSGGARPGEMLR